MQKMGNQKSQNITTTESEAYDVIKYVPIVGSVYSVPRIIAYASQGDTDRAIKSITGLGGNLVETGLVIGALVFSPAAVPAALGVEIIASGLSAGVWKGVEQFESEPKDLTVE